MVEEGAEGAEGRPAANTANNTQDKVQYNIFTGLFLVVGFFLKGNVCVSQKEGSQDVLEG